MNWRALVRSFDITQYLLKHDPGLKKSLPNVYLTCPVCERAEKLWVTTVDFKRPNPQTREPELVRAGTWICYYCGEGSRDDLVGLIERMEDCDRFDALEILYAGQRDAGAELGLREVVQDALFGVEDEAEIVDETMELPEMELPESFQLYTDADEKPAYFEERGITPARAKRFGLGFCTTGKYANRLVVPVHQDGRRVFFVARWMQATPPAARCPKCRGLGRFRMQADQPRVRCAKCKGRGVVQMKKTLYPVGSRPKQVIFGIERARYCKRIVLVEDVWSAMAHGDGWCALFGTDISSAQLSILLKTGAEEIVLLLDRDATVRHVKRERDCPKRQAGKVCADCKRYEKTQLIARRLAEFWRVRVPQLPDARDPDEHGRAFLERLIERTEPLRESDALRAAVMERL